MSPRRLAATSLGVLLGVLVFAPLVVLTAEPAATPTVRAWPYIPNPPPADAPPTLAPPPPSPSPPPPRAAPAPARTRHNIPAAHCRASWYGERFRGRPTASGRIYNPDELVAAHRSWPCGTRVEVAHAGRSVIVTIVDRGPFVAGRCLDLSRAAFARLAPTSAGVIPVALRRL